MLCIEKDGEKDVVYTNSIHDIFFCMYTTYRVLLVGNTDVLKILFLPKSGWAGSTRFFWNVAILAIPKNFIFQKLGWAGSNRFFSNVHKLPQISPTIISTKIELSRLNLTFFSGLSLSRSLSRLTQENPCLFHAPVAPGQPWQHVKGLITDDDAIVLAQRAATS